MNSIVYTNNLCFSYGKDLVVHNVNLAIPAGSIFGFVGPNGAGKSTTIKLLLGLLTQKSGTIEIFGKNLASARIEILRQVGSLVETPSLYPHLTGAENLEIVRRIMDIPRPNIDRVLIQSGIFDAKNKKVKEYSLGMKQRLGIALSLLHSPKLLILDEPINGLDPQGIQEFRYFLQLLVAEEEITVLLSSHILSELEQVITSVGIIAKGSMKFLGSMDQLRKRQEGKLVIEVSDSEKAQQVLSLKGVPAARRNSRHIAVHVSDRNHIAWINAELVGNAVDVYELKFEQPNLESVFLSLIQE